MKSHESYYHNIDKVQGFCLWLTGLSGSGKTTIAQSVVRELNSHNIMTSLLDGDIVREHLSKGLGFSRQDRDTNVLRIGYVASEIVRHNGVAICSAISPYADTRQRVRDMFAPGSIVETYVSTPIEECEKRDVKGLYKKARSGSIKGFTGIEDVYESPVDPDISIDTTGISVEDSLELVINGLAHRGLLVAARLRPR